MPRHQAPLYRRGKYWLDWDRRRDGSLRSPNLYVWRYDPDARRERSASTGTAAKDEAILALDRRYLADADEAPAWCHACGQPIAQAEVYLLADAIGDYRLEWGDARMVYLRVRQRLNRAQRRVRQRRDPVDHAAPRGQYAAKLRRRRSGSPTRQRPAALSGRLWSLYRICPHEDETDSAIRFIPKRRQTQHGYLSIGRPREPLLELLPRLRRFADALSRDRADADDLCQAAVEKALKAGDQWQPGTRMNSWMYRIMRNTWIDATRARQRAGETFLAEEAGREVGDDGARALEAAPNSGK